MVRMLLSRLHLPDVTPLPAIAAWLGRVAATPGAIRDLEPYRRPPTPGRTAAPRTTGRRPERYAVRSCAISSNAATNRSQSSIVWVIDRVHSSSRPGVMKMPRFML